MKDNFTIPTGGKGFTLEVDETFLGKQTLIFVNGKVEYSRYDEHLHR